MWSCTCVPPAHLCPDFWLCWLRSFLSSLTTASPPPPSIRHPLYQFIYYSCFLLPPPRLLLPTPPIPFHLPFLHLRSSRLRNTSVSISTRSEQHGRKGGVWGGGSGGARQGHHSALPAPAPPRRQRSAESLQLNGVSICSMRKLLFSIARGPFI